ncbi:MAG: hypothetical protein ACLFPE_11130 [Bacteroidales bacterium]
MVTGQDAPKFDIKFSGFVKTDIIWDSRQTVSVREGHFMLYPQPELPDPDGEDINAKSNFNILNVQTRAQIAVSGPDVWGAKSSAFVEGAFFGSAESNINTFRLRHALVKLTWPTTEFFAGQFWHPMFNAKSFPGTVSFNTGAPFQPFSRNPQVRLTQYFGNFNLALTAMSERDFTSTGPLGASSVYLRNTGYPALNLRFEYHRKKIDGKPEILAGVSGNFKALTPMLSTPEDYKTTTTVNSLSAAAYFKYSCDRITFKTYGFYGGDPVNLTMIGGYGVTNVTDSVRGLVEYSPMNTMSLWADFNTNGTTLQVGLFGGYSKNLGMEEEIEGPVYHRGMNIEYLWRIAPRLIYNVGKFRISPEIDYTVAAYATTSDAGIANIDSKGKVTDSEPVGNLRFLIGVYYFF